METVQSIIAGKKVLSTKKKVLLYKPFFRTVSCDQKYCKCMEAEQPEKTHLEESARSETQLRSQGPLLALPRLHVATKQTWQLIDGILIKRFFRL